MTKTAHCSSDSAGRARAEAREPGAALLGQGQHTAVRVRYGLSYGRFEYANLTVDPPTVTTSGTVTVSVEVTNTAHRKADEVVQLYIHQRYGSVSRPVRELKGFRRLTLAAGESRTLHFLSLIHI